MLASCEVNDHGLEKPQIFDVLIAELICQMFMPASINGSVGIGDFVAFQQGKQLEGCCGLLLIQLIRCGRGIESIA